MSDQMQENKMGVMPVKRLLITMSLPIMLSMLIQALYNIVDSVFVAQVSENALTAVSMAFPIQNLMISVGVGTGVGVNALLSRSLGEKDYDRANKAASNGVFLAVVSAIAFTILGVLIARPFFEIQTDVQEIIDCGTTYISICSALCFGIFIAIMFERLLQSTGRTFCTMISQGAGAIVNIVMDPVLIFGLGPFPRMEVAGAAAATVLGQMVSAALTVLFNACYNPEIQLQTKGFRPDGPTIGRIYAVGVPSIILSSIGSVMIFGLNQILIAFSTTATAVLGIYFKVQSFAFMPIFGLNNGMVPIVSYNLGARRKKRLIQTVKFAAVLAVGYMVACLLVLQFATVPILQLFNASEEMLAIGVPALRIISLSFLFAGFSVVVSATFQALGNGVLSMLVSIIRQLVVLLPAAWLLSLSGQVGLVWWAFPIAEVCSVLLCIGFMLYTYQKIIKPLPEGA